MRELPTGTVTFLFTDVEGSTKLLHELGSERYAEALAEHRRILRETFERHGGMEVDTQGDAFFVAFPTAPGALEAAEQALQALEPGAIRVRIGIHTGTPHLTEEGYVGSDVHRAARIAAAGHGGQVLVSAATAALLPADELRDMGEHRLKDLSAAERIYQFGDGDFPPLATLRQTNLPVPATPFLGREQELADVLGLSSRDDVRLLTLTGPGGTGKTRLALQAAAEAGERFRGGVFWVPLATLRDPRLVLTTAEQALGAKDTLAEHIGDKPTLVFFDNFEQVVEAAEELAALLAACPHLELLVTSREPLHVRGEQEYAVPPFANEDAVIFFVARARAVRPDFQPDDAVPEICRRLDDLPLALELAAARAKALSSAQILQRLEQRLPLLTGGARDVPERQRTLRATIEWSYELLSEDEHRLFARLAVFPGGSTLEAAEQVSGADLDTLQSLVDKSLLRHAGERYWMLETIREYASERLEEAEEAATIRDRQLEFFLAVAERAYDEASTSETEWSPIVDAEHDNIRAALDWAMTDRPEAEARLIAAVAPYWHHAGYIDEARERLTGVLERYIADDAVRARALTELGNLLDGPDALSCLDEALALWRRLGERRGEALALEAIGYEHVAVGEHKAARRAFEESLALRRQVGAPEVEEASALLGLCRVLVSSAEIEGVERLAEQLLELGTRHQDRMTVMMALHYLADCPLIGGNYVEAEKRYLRALAYGRESGILTQTPSELLGVAMAVAAQGDHARAVRLAGAAYARREALGYPRMTPILWWRRIQERYIGGARAQLAPKELEEAERAGRDTPFEAILDEALAAEGE